jgi:hypothetical protein
MTKLYFQSNAVWIGCELLMGFLACCLPVAFAGSLTEDSLRAGLVLAGLLLVPSETLRQFLGPAALRTMRAGHVATRVKSVISDAAEEQQGHTAYLTGQEEDLQALQAQMLQMKNVYTELGISLKSLLSDTVKEQQEHTAHLTGQKEDLQALQAQINELQAQMLQMNSDSKALFITLKGLVSDTAKEQQEHSADLSEQIEELEQTLANFVAQMHDLPIRVGPIGSSGGTPLSQVENVGYPEESLRVFDLSGEQPKILDLAHLGRASMMIMWSQGESKWARGDLNIERLPSARTTGWPSLIHIDFGPQIEKGVRSPLIEGQYERLLLALIERLRPR